MAAPVADVKMDELKSDPNEGKKNTDETENGDEEGKKDDTAEKDADDGVGH